MPDRTFGGVELTRAAPAPVPGALDDHFYEIVEARFRRVVESEPAYATHLGIHAWDDMLGDPSRERVLDDIAADRAHLTAIEGIDPAGLVRGGGIRARPGDPPRPPGDLPGGDDADLGAAINGRFGAR